MPLEIGKWYIHKLASLLQNAGMWQTETVARFLVFTEN